MKSFTAGHSSGDTKMVKGSARIAINEWLSQFNVRMAEIKAPAGLETMIKVTPTYRSSSNDIKKIDPKDRLCRFLDEVQVMKNLNCLRVINSNYPFCIPEKGK